MVSDSVTFDLFPIWQGVTEEYGDFNAKKLTLTMDNEGVISQPYWYPEYFENTQYTEKQYNHITTLPGVSSIANSRNTRYVSFITDSIRQYTCKKPLHILEIGGGNIYTAEQLMRSEDISQYVIVDPALDALNIECNEKISLIPEYYSSKTIEKTFDVIISINCLEHVLYPTNFLKGIRKNLAPEGIAILFFPECENQLCVGDINMAVHEHLSYFTAASFVKVIEKIGLKTLFLTRKNDLIQTVLSNEEIVLAKTSPTSLLSSNVLSDFNLRCNETITQIGNFIKDLSYNDTLLFHGATNGLNSIFFLLNNQIQDIPWDKIIIVDNDETKIGKYLPCINTPIQQPSKKFYEKAKYIIISAPTFFEEIKNDIISRFSLNNKIISILDCRIV